MTAHAMKGDQERCLEAGMDGYVSKPLNSEDLSRAIQEAIRKFPTARTLKEKGHELKTD
jgi:CheY-like chemotaxis protein